MNFLQLIVTIGIIALFIYPPQIREYVQRNQWVYFSSFGVMMVSVSIWVVVLKLD